MEDNSSFQSKSWKVGHRTVIFFLFKEGVSYHDIHVRLLTVLVGTALSKESVHLWANEFHRGRTALEDEPRSGRLATAVTDENVAVILDSANKDRRIKLHEIAETFGFNKERVGFIMPEKLGFRRVCARWVPDCLLAT